MLRLLIKEVRHRWIIHMLTVLLMAFIVAILVVQSSLNTSAEDKINELTHKLGQGMLVVPEGTDLESFYSMRYGPEVMPDDYGERIKNSPLRKHAGMTEPRLYGNITVEGTDLIIIGENQQFVPFGKADHVPAVIGVGAARVLGLRSGDILEVQGTKFGIVKVLDPPPKGYDMGLFVPLNTAQGILGKPGMINALNLGGCWCKLDIPAFAAQVENTLPGTMAITIDGMAKAQTEINSLMERYSLLLWIAGTVLVAGSIAFLIFYMVRKGEREIGLLLSIGLSPIKIILKNISMAIIIALVGVLLGHIMSIPLMSWFGKAILRISLAPSWQYLPHFLAGSLMIGLIASSVPSWLVTRLDPTSLMREE